MLPWIATTLFLVMLSEFAPGNMADTIRLFAIGYGALTVFVVAPVWATVRLAQIVSRREPALVKLVA